MKHMTSYTTVRPWGNSQGIRIPKDILDSLQISVHDELSMRIHNSQLILEKKVRRKTLEEYAEPYGGTLGPYEEFDFGEDMGIERWLHAED